MNISSLPSLRDIESFLLVVEAGAFRRAARNEKCLQSTLSRRVRRLEDILGVSLLERSPGGVRLTNAGQAFFERVVSALESFEEAVELAGSAGIGANGSLNIGILSSLSCSALRTLIADMRDRYPEVMVTLREGAPMHLKRALRSHELDVLFSPEPRSPEDIDLMTLCHEQLLVAASRNSAIAQKKLIAWDDLATEELLVQKNDIGPQIITEIRTSADQHHSRIDISIQNVSRDTLLKMVQMNAGITLCPASWAHPNDPDIVLLSLNEKPMIQYAIQWSPRNDNPALRRFLSLARISAAASPSVASRTPDPSP